MNLLGNDKNFEGTGYNGETIPQCVFFTDPREIHRQDTP
jgi:hypothetical protein